MNTFKSNPLSFYHAYVFHRNTPNFLGSAPVVASEFTAIAFAVFNENNATVLNTMFEATNSIETHWIKQQQFDAFKIFANNPSLSGNIFVDTSRSTSTGDVIVIGNTVFRLGIAGWEICSEANALEFMALIKRPEACMQAIVDALSDKLKVELSFGYIGNIERWGDDRSFRVFFQPGKGLQTMSWGYFGPSDLATMVTEALTKLEPWIQKNRPN